MIAKLSLNQCCTSYNPYVSATAHCMPSIHRTKANIRMNTALKTHTHTLAAVRTLRHVFTWAGRRPPMLLLLLLLLSPYRNMPCLTHTHFFTFLTIFALTEIWNFVCFVFSTMSCVCVSLHMWSYIISNWLPFVLCVRPTCMRQYNAIVNENERLQRSLTVS